MRAYTGRHARLLILSLAAAVLSLLAACAAPSGQATIAPASSTAAAAASTPASTSVPTTTGAAASQAPACVPPPAGMVAWWRAEGDASDAVGTNLGSLNGVTIETGKVGRAFTTDGTSQYVEVAGASDLQLKTAISIEGWVYAAGAPNSYAGIAGTWDDNSGANRTYLFWVLNGGLEFIVSPDGSSLQRASDPTPLPLDAWVHVAATYDGTTIHLYRDGAEVASAAMSGSIALNDKAFLIGRTEGGSVGPNFWKGGIDELTVYSRALGPAEIAAIHTAGSAGKCRA